MKCVGPTISSSDIERIRQAMEFTPELEEAAELGVIREALVMLTVRRGDRTEIMHERYALKPGDVSLVAINAPDRERAHQLLEERGWRPFVPESDAESAEAS